jgi:hypothetical protein
MNLSLTIECGLAHLPQRVRLNLVDLSNDSSDILVETFWHLSSGVLRYSGGGVRTPRVTRGQEYESAKREKADQR